VWGGMGRIMGFYAKEELVEALENKARKRRKSVSHVIRRILNSRIKSKEIVIAIPKEEEWIVGKYLLEQFPKDLKDFKERVTGKYEDVKVRVYLK
jgi:hypothetical protein